MKKILIVDDSLLDRKLLMRVLSKAGVENEILQAENGEVGLGVLAENYQNIALILLDYQMPKMSGIEFMQGMMEVPSVKDIPVIMITASSAQENKDVAYKANPNLAGYIIKPYKPEGLLEAVKPHL